MDEIRLSEQFSLSRSPIREALIRLSGEGLVQISPNRSAIVTPMDFGRMAEYLDALDLLQRVVTRLAASHRSEADLKEIIEAQKAYEESLVQTIASDDSLLMIEKNYEFHMAIARAGRNFYFSELYRRLLLEGQRMLHLHFEFEKVDVDFSAEKMSSDHANIVAAIRNQDMDRAEYYAHKHAEQFKGRFMQFLNRNYTNKISLQYSGRPELVTEE
ncbi:phosphonate utilization associated transcriptional regulator [compost metagenome]